jgi:hypothetical protein
VLEMDGTEPRTAEANASTIENWRKMEYMLID